MPALPARKPESMDNFDGRRFHNLYSSGRPRRSGDLLRWLRTRKPGHWAPLTGIDAGPPPPRRVAGERLRITLINHATLLIQTCSLNILTDPIWSERASMAPFLGPRRYRPPGIAFDDLPPIDLILLSHNHYDHLDLPSLRRLARTHHPVVLTGLGNRRLLQRAGIDNIAEMDWWQRHRMENASIVATPAQHWSGRGLFDRNRTLWLSFVLEAPEGPVYFAGDTAMAPHFDLIRARFGPMRLALLPIGAFLPRWFMRQAHLSPRQAIQAHRRLRAQTSVAIHYGTFALGDDGQYRAEQELAGLCQRDAALAESFWILPFGEGREVPTLTRRVADAPGLSVDD